MIPRKKGYLNIAKENENAKRNNEVTNLVIITTVK